jgi:hypothetical protein
MHQWIDQENPLAMTAQEEQIKILTNTNRLKTGVLPPMVKKTIQSAEGRSPCPDSEDD